MGDVSRTDAPQGDIQTCPDPTDYDLLGPLDVRVDRTRFVGKRQNTVTLDPGKE